MLGIGNSIAFLELAALSAAGEGDLMLFILLPLGGILLGVVATLLYYRALMRAPRAKRAV